MSCSSGRLQSRSTSSTQLTVTSWVWRTSKDLPRQVSAETGRSTVFLTLRVQPNWMHGCAQPSSRTSLEWNQPTSQKTPISVRLMPSVPQSRKTGRIQSHIPTIEVELYQRWRQLHPLPVQNPETIAFDLTPIPTYGTECPLDRARSETHETHLNQLNLSVMASVL